MPRRLKQSKTENTSSVDGVMYRPAVLVGHIEPNNWNYNRQSDFVFDKEVRSIQRHGMVDPILVRTLDSGVFEIIDGEHRWKAVKYLKHKTMPVYDVGKMSAAFAEQLTVIMNETKGRPDYLRLGALLQELNDGGRLERDLVPFKENFLLDLLHLQIDLNTMSNYQDVMKDTHKESEDCVKRSYQLLNSERGVVEAALELASGKPVSSKRAMGIALVKIARWTLNNGR